MCVRLFQLWPKSADELPQLKVFDGMKSLKAVALTSSSRQEAEALILTDQSEFPTESEAFQSDRSDSRCLPDTTFDCKFASNSAQIAALSERAAVVFSPRFTSYYSLVTVETDPESQSVEETTSAVKINEV